MPTPPRKTVTLVLGGARSGKSRYAQELASRFKRVVYVATAKGSDAEMRARIARHRRERPSTWKTVEVDTDLDCALREHGSAGDLLLVDCLTVYMANIMGRRRDRRRRFEAKFRSCARRFATPRLRWFWCRTKWAAGWFLPTEVGATIATFSAK